MARSRRNWNTKQRDKMIARKMAVAAAMKKKPSTTIEMAASIHGDAGKNIVIARSQAKAGRNPWSMRERDLADILKTVQTDLDRLRDGDKSLLPGILNRVGAALVARMRANIDSQRGLRPVKPEYAARNPGKILKRTGALYDALRFKINLGG